MDVLDNITLEIPFSDTAKNLPDPDLLMFYKDIQDRHFWIESEISIETCSYFAKYIYALNRNTEDKETPITIHIASNGGDLATMFMLYNAILNSKIPVHTINECGAHSAAFIVFLAGHKRTMNPDALFVAHEGSGMMGGSFRENKYAMRQYEKDVNRMKAIIAERTNLSLEDIENQFEKEQDWYIGEEDAKKFGIITE